MRFLVLWEIDKSRISVDRKERGQGWKMMAALIRQNMEKGLTRDWGTFVCEASGYAIMEGSELDVMNNLQQYVPFVTFKVNPVATLD
ncbi:MAG: hypothetical protein ACQERN_09495 [Thermodesulfobacteriota bacterium]